MQAIFYRALRLRFLDVPDLGRREISGIIVVDCEIHLSRGCIPRSHVQFPGLLFIARLTKNISRTALQSELIPKLKNYFLNLDFEIISRATDQKSSHEIPMDMETNTTYSDFPI